MSSPALAASCVASFLVHSEKTLPGLEIRNLDGVRLRNSTQIRFYLRSQPAVQLIAQLSFEGSSRVAEAFASQEFLQGVKGAALKRPVSAVSTKTFQILQRAVHNSARSVCSCTRQPIASVKTSRMQSLKSFDFAVRVYSILKITVFQLFF